MRDLFGFGDDDLSIDELEEKIDAYTSEIHSYKKSKRQLQKCIKCVEIVEPEEWVKNSNMRRIRMALETKRDKPGRLGGTDKNVPRLPDRHRRGSRVYLLDPHGTKQDILDAVAETFDRFEPYESGSGPDRQESVSEEEIQEAQIRKNRTLKSLNNILNKIEEDYISELEKKKDELERMKHDKKSGKDFETGSVNQPDDLVNDKGFTDEIEEFSTDAELREIEVKKELENQEEEPKDILSLEQTALYIAEYVRSKIGKENYDVETIHTNENMYPTYIKDIQSSIKITESREDMKNQLKSIHEKSEYMEASLTGAHIMYIVNRVYDGHSSVPVKELRSYQDR